MKQTGLIFFLFITSVNSTAQDVFWPTSDYHTYACPLRDSLFEVTFSGYNYRATKDALDCIPAYDYWQWLAYMDNPDSVQNAFRKRMSAVMGKPAAERLYISSVSYYQDPDGRMMDSSDTAYFNEFSPWCVSLAYEYECYLLFNDSVWLPVTVLMNSRGQILNKADIPTTLTTEQSFQLMSICEIYERILSDPYLAGEDIKPYADLHYSTALKLFYFEFECWSGELLEETSNSWLSEHKHIFIDAHTGKILWRTTAKHYEEHGGCVISMRVELPANSLTGD